MHKLLRLRVVKESYLTLKISNKPSEDKNQMQNKNTYFPYLHIDRINPNEKQRFEEDLDDYYEKNFKYQYGRDMIDFEAKKKHYLSKKTLSKNSGKYMAKLSSYLPQDHDEYIDIDKEDLENYFLKIYKKKLEKPTKNDEEILDDETRRYLVNFAEFEEDEDDAYKNENFEERMKKSKRHADQYLEFAEYDDNLDLNFAVFTIDTLKDLRDLAFPLCMRNKVSREKPRLPEPVILDLNVLDLKLVEQLDHKHKKRDADVESDTSIDEFKNMKKLNNPKANVSLSEGNSPRKKKENFNVRPRYMDFYHNKEEKYFKKKNEPPLGRPISKVINLSKKSSMIKK